MISGHGGKEGLPHEDENHRQGQQGFQGAAGQHGQHIALGGAQRQTQTAPASVATNVPMMGIQPPKKMPPTKPPRIAPKIAFQLAPTFLLNSVVSSRSLVQARMVRIPRKSNVGHPMA